MNFFSWQRTSESLEQGNTFDVRTYTFDCKTTDYCSEQYLLDVVSNQSVLFYRYFLTKPTGQPGQLRSKKTLI